MDDDRRQLYVPRNRDPVEDICILADALAASDAELFDKDGSLALLDNGSWVQLNPTLLSAIVAKHIVVKRLVKRGGKWQVEYSACQVDEATLRALLTARSLEEGGLVFRLPRAPDEPRQLSNQQREEIQARCREGEPVDSIARSYGVDAGTVRQLAR